MLVEMLIRFFVGGLVVSAFAVIGELFSPKTFSGIFGAAPSVAIATLGLTYVRHGPTTVAIEARWMMIASAAMLAYCASSAAIARRDRIPVWAAALSAWLAWFAVAAALRWIATVIA